MAFEEVVSGLAQVVSNLDAINAHVNETYDGLVITNDKLVKVNADIKASTSALTITNATLALTDAELQKLSLVPGTGALQLAGTPLARDQAGGNAGYDAGTPLPGETYLGQATPGPGKKGGAASKAPKAHAGPLIGPQGYDAIPGSKQDGGIGQAPGMDTESADTSGGGATGATNFGDLAEQFGRANWYPSYAIPSVAKAALDHIYNTIEVSGWPDLALSAWDNWLKATLNNSTGKGGLSQAAYWLGQIEGIKARVALWNQWGSGFAVGAFDSMRPNTTKAKAAIIAAGTASGASKTATGSPAGGPSVMKTSTGAGGGSMFAPTFSGSAVPGGNAPQHTIEGGGGLQDVPAGSTTAAAPDASRQAAANAPATLNNRQTFLAKIAEAWALSKTQSTPEATAAWIAYAKGLQKEFDAVVWAPDVMPPVQSATAGATVPDASSQPAANAPVTLNNRQTFLAKIAEAKALSKTQSTPEATAAWIAYAVQLQVEYDAVVWAPDVMPPAAATSPAAPAEDASRQAAANVPVNLTPKMAFLAKIAEAKAIAKTQSTPEGTAAWVAYATYLQVTFDDIVWASDVMPPSITTLPALGSSGRVGVKVGGKELTPSSGAAGSGAGVGINGNSLIASRAQGAGQ